jgi:peptidoglycan/LPS O-acetylase OafA/YrhL
MRFFTDIPARLRRITSAGKYRPEIDGLRFFAIAIVAVDHLYAKVLHFHPKTSPPLMGFEATILSYFNHPGSGVMIFFAISGFIITSQFLKKNEHPLSGSFLSTYFSRRATRIEPPYFILLVATFLVLEITNFVPPGVTNFFSAPKSLTASLIASLLYSHSWFYGTEPRLFAPGWTLEVEVQFYLLAPLLFFAFFRQVGDNIRSALGLVVLVCLVILDTATYKNGNPHLIHTLAAVSSFFWLGILLADLNKRYTTSFSKIPAPLAGILGWGGLLAFLWLNEFESPWIPDAVIYAFRVLCVAAMFISALAQGSFKRFCSLPWISLIGGACYSIYLTHMQVLQVGTWLFYKAFGPVMPDSWTLSFAINLLVQIPLATAIGLTFYVLIERPFMTPHWPSIFAARAVEIYRGVRSKARKSSGIL